MAELSWLDKSRIAFPPVSQALVEPNGLLAVGGDLTPTRLVEAYRQGIFPWYEDGQPILWWSPDPRLILRPAEVHISRSLGKILRKGEFFVTLNRAFTAVIAQCAGLRQDQPGTWITDDMRRAYIRLHQLGYAHSVETWQDGELVGGLYGVAIGRAFFGESMFSQVSNSSKVALVTLCQQLAQWQFGFIDCQVETEHLLSMGAEKVSRADFQTLLARFAVANLATADWPQPTTTSA